MRRLLRSGWWVALLAAGLGALVAAYELRSPAGERALQGDGSSLASYGFDLGTCLVPRHALVPSGLPRDGLVVLDEPALLSVAAVEERNRQGHGKLLLETDRVVGVVVAGEARAYPLRLLRWHEVVNDTVAGVPILVTYNPLCDAVVVARRPGGRGPVRYGFSGLLYQSNLLLYDRQAVPGQSSLFSQVAARAIAGPAAARHLDLDLLPASLTSWGWWRSHYPTTTILAPLPRLRTLYARNPYSSYFGSDLLRFPVDPLPPAGALPLKERIVVLSLAGRDAVLSLSRLAAAVGSDRGSWSTTLGTTPITIEFDAALGTAVVEAPRPASHGLAVRYAFWFAWYATHPDTPLPGPPR